MFAGALINEIKHFDEKYALEIEGLDKKMNKKSKNSLYITKI
jgi:hypothetical protein